MATRRQKMKVGLFLLVSFVGIAAGITVISGLYEQEGISYYIQFDDSILGLYDGAMVHYLGVPVGRVRDIYVTPEKRARVEIVIDPAKVTLQKGVQAELVIYSLAAGTMAISLSGGDVSNPELPEFSLIPATPSVISAVSEEVQEMMTNINQIAQVVNEGLTGMEKGDLNAIVEKANGLLDDAAGFMDDGRDLVATATDTIDDVRSQAQPAIDEAMALSKDLRELTADARELIQNANAKVSELDVGQAQGELQKVLENMAELSAKINTTMSEFDNMTANVMHEADNVEYSLRRSLQELAESLDTMRGFVEELKQNPSSLLRGRPVPEERR